MHEPTNYDRAMWAETALDAFAHETGQDHSGDLSDEPGSVISDLVCDLYHLCQIYGVDPQQIQTRAWSNFQWECSNEERSPVIVTIRGGMVQSVDNLPPGVDVEIRDYDVSAYLTPAEMAAMDRDENGDPFHRFEFGGG